MSKLHKFAKIFGTVEPLAKVALPGGVGAVLDIVNEQLATGEHSQAITTLAADSDDQTAAILALHEENEELKKRLEALESKL